MLAVGAGSALATRAGRSANVRVIPATGLQSTRFTVSFTAPDSSGRVGALERAYQVTAAAGQAAGCASRVTVRVPRTRAHARVQVVLVPSGKWCVGEFSGRVVESQGPWCPRRAMLCPKFVSSVRTLGRFTFRVQAAGGGTGPPGTGGQSGSAPTFAGLVKAYACTPGPQRPGQTTPFALTWNAASDAVTPASQIVYDVFMSTTPGGEDFAQPTWTTAPGVTRFTTPGLQSHGTFYFVVRARDQAGNEDQNTVERQGVDPCY